MACLRSTGRLFYRPARLRAVNLDKWEDRELYPSQGPGPLPTCTADGKYVAFVY